MSAIDGKTLVKLVREKISELDDRELNQLLRLVNHEWEKRLFKGLGLDDVCPFKFSDMDFKFLEFEDVFSKPLQFDFGEANHKGNR